MYPKEEEIRALGEESNFFDRENAEIELGEHIKTYRYGLQTFVERHKNGFVIYHLGNKKYTEKKKLEKYSKPPKYWEGGKESLIGFLDIKILNQKKEE